MKKLLLTLALVLMASPAAAQLVITGVFDGPLLGGTPKGVQLFACDDIADLSVYGIGSANNGGGTDGAEVVFPAAFIAAGTTFYVASEAPQFTAWFGFGPEYTSGAMSINGDDAIELFLVDGLGEPIEVVDIFGDINMDGTGLAWDHVDGWAKRVINSGPDGSTFVLTNWIFSGPDALDGETTNDTAAIPFPVAGFSCDPTVGVEVDSWGNVKSLFR